MTFTRYDALLTLENGLPSYTIRAFCGALPLLAALWCTQTSAQEGTARVEEEARDSKTNAIPVVGYTPETGAVGAAVMISTFYADSSSQQRSMIDAAVAMTTRSQLRLRTGTRLSLDNDFYFIQLNVSYLDWETDYFGIGEATRSQEETFSFRSLESRPEFSVQILDNVFAGVTANYAYRDYRRDNTLSLFESNLLGTQDGHYPGVGGVLRYDTRDRPMAARRGEFVRFRALHFPRELGNPGDYSRFSLDLRGFRSFRGFTVGGRVLGRSAYGDVPFWQLPRLGGARDGRGNRVARFTDRKLALTQLDVRTPSLWGFAGVVFASAGVVAPRTNELLEAEPHFTQGLGVRYFLQEEAGIAFRVDVGFGTDGTQAYVSVGEAF